jgi:hypothetical protein
MTRPRAVLLLVAALGLLVAHSAAAHNGGKAEPRIAAGIGRGAGLVRVLTVRLTDVDSGKPIAGARVVAFAEMTFPHVMRLVGWPLAERTGGVYRAAVRFPMPALWRVTLRVGGREVVPASSSLPVRIEPASVAPATGGSTAGPVALPTVLEDKLTVTDVERIAVLWLHSIAALGWIVGVLAMAVALSIPPQASQSGLRARLADGYRAWGAWLHWSLVPVIVVTGIYNTVYSTPFPLVWRPSAFGELARIPYGALYEAILFVKLGLFGALLVTGTQVLVRTVRPRQALPAEAGPLRALAAALGPPGLFYLVTVPLILAAVAALRYVHVLSHVAEVLETR